MQVLLKYLSNILILVLLTQLIVWVTFIILDWLIKFTGFYDFNIWHINSTYKVIYSGILAYIFILKLKWINV